MSRTSLAAATALLAFVQVAAASRVGAAEPEPFGKRGRVVVVLDHLAGILKERVQQISPAGQVGDSAFGISHYGGIDGYYAIGPISRLGVHLFATDHVSVGTGVHYSEAPIGATDGNSLTTLGISPRFGFETALSPTVALWLRAGVTYLHMDYGRHVAGHDLMVGGEFQLVMRVVQHFSVTIGPTLELGIAGGVVNDTGTLGSIKKTSQTRREIYGITMGFAFDL